MCLTQVTVKTSVQIMHVTHWVKWCSSCMRCEHKSSGRVRQTSHTLTRSQCECVLGPLETFSDFPDGGVSVRSGISHSFVFPVPSFPCCDGETLGVTCPLFSGAENLWIRIFTLPDRVRLVPFILISALLFFVSSSVLLFVTPTCPFESTPVFFELHNMSLLSISWETNQSIFQHGFKTNCPF